MYMCMHCRFVYKGQWREKINSYVDFPTRNLDLNPYLEGPKSIKSSYRLYATSVSFQIKGVLWGFFFWVGGGGSLCYNLATDWLIFVCLCKIILFSNCQVSEEFPVVKYYRKLCMVVIQVLQKVI